jgi:diaminohydroxyphosphoribosylaminopyrimidine deaminase/5-amino-6-(5-phosphoribosylamino)uracil reductase
MVSSDVNKFMKRALKLAAFGGRAVAPNPMVGAVVVKGGRVIGEGWHEKFGGPHAEVNAIADAHRRGHDTAAATIYVTLEPCRHTGKTPPCTLALLKAGIAKVVIGSKDPFQKEFIPSGLTYKMAPVSIQKKCIELNKFFFTWVQKGRPYITVKVAVSKDGFVAGEAGKPVHITSEAQDKQVHTLRAAHQAILVGSNTVINDDPHLGVRLTEGEDPLRVILDSKQRVPKTARVFRDSNYWWVTRKMPLSTLMRELGQRGISSLLVEPGPTLYGELKRAGLIDELIVLKGAKKLGGGLSICI